MKKLILFFIVLFCFYNTYAQKNLAKVETKNGILVFSDNKPTTEYTVLGEVSFTGANRTSVMYSQYGAIPITILAKYNEIRNGLIVNSVLANKEVEAIIITTISNGKGTASMIKFKEPVKENSIAEVNKHQGIYIFTDCVPQADYNYLGKKSINSSKSEYRFLCEKLIKKCLSKWKYNLEGIILHFTEEGKSVEAEAISFK